MGRGTLSLNGGGPILGEWGMELLLLHAPGVKYGEWRMILGEDFTASLYFSPGVASFSTQKVHDG